MRLFSALPRRTTFVLVAALIGSTGAAGIPVVASPSPKPAAARAEAVRTAIRADDGLSMLRTGHLPVLVDDPTAEVLAVVEAAGGVPLAGGRCAPGDVVLSYEEPGDGWKVGAHVSPLVAPNGIGSSVSGVAVCADGSRHGYVGFEAIHADGHWTVQLVPDPAGGVDDGEPEHASNTIKNDPAPAKSPVPVSPGTPLVGLVDGPDIEGYAPYEGQSTCDPTAKPGTVALRNLLLARYPSSSSLGITRACASGGKSEHKEGRALDWGVNVNNAVQKAAAEDFIADLLATDAHGNAHALVRRMGVMYVIWNGRIWSAYQAGAGWRTYTGSSPHTDHVHLSLSWAGARAQTSFWSGTVVPGLPDRPLGSGSGTGSTARRRTTTTPDAATTDTTAPRRRRSTTPTTEVAADLGSTTQTTLRWRRSSTSTTAPSVSVATTPSTTSTTVRRWATTSTTAPRVTTTTAPRWWATTTTTAPRTTTTTAPRWWATTTTTTAPRPTTTTTAAPTTTTTAAG